MRGTSAAQLLWSPAEADQCASIMRCTSEADALRFHPCGGSWHNGHIGTRTSFCCRCGQWWVSWAKCAVQKDLWQPPHTSGKKSSRRQCAQGAPIQSIDPVPWPAWLIPSPPGPRGAWQKSAITWQMRSCGAVRASHRMLQRANVPFGFVRPVVDASSVSCLAFRRSTCQHYAIWI